MCLFLYYTRLLFCLFWVCWVRENFSGGPGHIFSCVGLRCVGRRAGTILFGRYPGVDGGTVQIFFFSGPVVAGTVRLKW